MRTIQLPQTNDLRSGLRNQANAVTRERIEKEEASVALFGGLAEDAALVLRARRMAALITGLLLMAFALIQGQ